MKFVRAMDRINEAIGKFLGWWIIPLTGVVAYDVFMRYLFRSPTVWAYEVALHLYSISFLLAGAWVLKRNAHIRVDVLYNRFSPRLKSIINLFSLYVCVGIMSFIVIRYGISYLIMSYTSQEVSAASPLREVLWPLRACLVLAFILLSLQAIAESIREIGYLRKGERP